MKSKLFNKRNHKAIGFTLIELLIVITIIGILAAITVIAYVNITGNAAAAVLKSDIKEAAGQLALAKASDGSYPANANDLPKSADTVYQYTLTGSDYCLSATSPKAGTSAYHISSTTVGGVVEDGLCSGHTMPVNITDGIDLQLITDANCPTTRTRAVDARDNHTYWVQKLADGKCWMLTNLAYAGGGTNTYNDTKIITNDTNSYSGGTYTTASYYIVPVTTNFTTEPASPSVSIDGTGQYGYLYNWCGAMGGQVSTSACSNATTPAYSTAISICPAGWRLPTGEAGTGEFTVLNNTINSGSTSTEVGLRTNWLAQFSGDINQVDGGFGVQGMYGEYWSSTHYSASSAIFLNFSNYGSVTPVSGGPKHNGRAVRCVAF